MLRDGWRGFVKGHTKLTALGTAATIVIVGLGAFTLLPHRTNSASEAQPVRMVTAQQQVAENRVSPPPRMLENGAPFSFADLVERVSPAVVTITAETSRRPRRTRCQPLDDLPAPFRDFFNQYGQGRPVRTPHKAVSMGSGFIIDKSRPHRHQQPRHRGRQEDHRQAARTGAASTPS